MITITCNQDDDTISIKSNKGEHITLEDMNVYQIKEFMEEFLNILNSSGVKLEFIDEGEVHTVDEW